VRESRPGLPVQVVPYAGQKMQKLVVAIQGERAFDLRPGPLVVRVTVEHLGQRELALQLPVAGSFGRAPA
jgi:hypothetical protein